MEREGQGGGAIPAGITVGKIAKGRVMRFDSGEADFSNCEEIRDQFDANDDESCVDWVFNLSSVTFVDSEVIKAILTLASIVTKRTSGRVCIVCKEENRRVGRVLEVLGIGRCLSIFDAEEEALT